jgi:aerobic-type carbon monoxide dehydrogenase small subunit (CoxS/CutS family)
VTTIEGVSPDGSHPIQMAWKEFDSRSAATAVGMIMSALALLAIARAHRRRHRRARHQRVPLRHLSRVGRRFPLAAD